MGGNTRKRTGASRGSGWQELHSEEALITQYSGARLRMDLDRVPLWRGDQVGLKQLWSDYSQYLYLPRLRDSAVLLEAVRSGLALFTWSPDTFAYADAFDEATGRYSGLVAGQLAAAVVLDAMSVLVKPDVAAVQLSADQRSAQESSERGEHTGNGRTGSTQRSTGKEEVLTAPGTKEPTRFYGRVSLEPVRMLRDLGEIADAIVAQLGRADAEVKITLEIEATSEKGFGEDVRRSVGENARTLRFDAHEFEEG